MALTEQELRTLDYEPDAGGILVITVDAMSPKHSWQPSVSWIKTTRC